MKVIYHSPSTKFWTLTALTLAVAAANAQGSEKLPPVFAVTSPITSTVLHPMGSVLKVKLDAKLQSNVAQKGDTFTATLDTGKAPDYLGLPAGTKIAGHIIEAQAKEGKTPGKIELQPDTIILKDGTRYPIEASFMKIDKKSVVTENGYLMATKPYRSGESNYIVTGALVGAGLAAITGGDLLAGGFIGAIIGYFVGKSNGAYAQDVTIKQGTVLGVRFNQDTPIEIAVN